MEALLIVWYFALTTLSTIGFGDFSPQTPEERLVVATFSFIMNQFIEILLNYKSLWVEG